MFRKWTKANDLGQLIFMLTSMYYMITEGTEKQILLPVVGLIAWFLFIIISSMTEYFVRKFFAKAKGERVN